MIREIIKPPKLRADDTIMLISPAAGLAGIEALSHRADNGKAWLEKRHFKVIEGHHAHLVGERAGTPEQRASDIHDGLENPDVKALISMIGGDYVCAEVLPHLDYDLIRFNPKIFMGYSDITSLLLAIHAKTGLVTFYGPAVMTQFGEYPEPLLYTINSFRRAVMSSSPIGEINASSEWTEEGLDWGTKADLERPRNMQSSSGWEWIQEGKAKGKLLGGCIQVLTNLIKRYPDYVPDFTDSLFFWESAEKDLAVGHSPEEVATDLKKLKDYGILDKMAGMIVGRPYCYTDEWHQELKKKIIEIVDDPNKPILYNVEIGHTDPILTIPIGIDAEINSSTQSFSILSSAVE